ncbi:hypothetical protein Tco_0484138 [Tanacetum coccineum]
MPTERGDGVASIKQRRHDLRSDGVSTLGGIHVECDRMLSDLGLRAFVGVAAMAVIPNVSRTPSFVIILVGPAVAGQGWLDTLCWCFVNAWLALCDYTLFSNLMYLLWAMKRLLRVGLMDRVGEIARILAG